MTARPRRPRASLSTPVAGSISASTITAEPLRINTSGFFSGSLTSTRRCSATTASSVFQAGLRLRKHSAKRVLIVGSSFIASLRPTQRACRHDRNRSSASPGGRVPRGV